MNGKDLLAVLVMIAPGILLIALIAFSLVPASVMQPFPGSGQPRDESRKQPDPQDGAEKAMRRISVRAEPETATQNRMRNPWEKPADAGVLKASAR